MTSFLANSRVQAENTCIDSGLLPRPTTEARDGFVFTAQKGTREKGIQDQDTRQRIIAHPLLGSSVSRRLKRRVNEKILKSASGLDIRVVCGARWIRTFSWSGLIGVLIPNSFCQSGKVFGDKTWRYQK
ncbi:hypothetical protein Fot_24290 [Forsythia ovata]|uniref:Uncharacterized protein n=1 Tax=Forsythia ovata TaxID=205694 RepID=A0ABD1U5V5_9LAMI